MDLVPYMMKMLQSGGTSLVPSGRDLVRTYGQFSEVPPGLSGPAQPRIGYIHNGEVQPPPREVASKPTPRYGPIIDGEVVRSAGAAGARGLAGSLAPLANPLLAAIMGSIQGDVLNNHQPRMYGPSAPAHPVGQVNAEPLPPVPAGDTFADRFSAAPGPTANQYVAQNFMHMAPPAPQPPQAPAPLRIPVTGGTYDYSGNSAKLSDMAAGHAYRPERSPAVTPMPQPRPAEAPQSQPQDMGFFARNTAMMSDPVTGQFIDPAAAARAQAQMGQGSIIKKMLSYLHDKADNS